MIHQLISASSALQKTTPIIPNKVELVGVSPSKNKTEEGLDDVFYQRRMSESNSSLSSNITAPPTQGKVGGGFFSHFRSSSATSLTDLDKVTAIQARFSGDDFRAMRTRAASSATSTTTGGGGGGVKLGMARTGSGGRKQRGRGEREEEEEGKEDGGLHFLSSGSGLEVSTNETMAPLHVATSTVQRELPRL